MAQAFLIGAQFLDGAPVALVLGDNLFHGSDLVPQLVDSYQRAEGATVFAYPVSDPERYGVAEFDKNRQGFEPGREAQTAQEPLCHHWTVFLRRIRCSASPLVKPSARGELEITRPQQDVSR